MAAKSKLREIAADLDPLKLLEEMRAVQAYLAALADGETPPPATSEPPNLAAFVEAYRAPGPRAKSVRPSPSKPNRVTCEVYKSLNTNPYCGSHRRAQAGDPTHSCRDSREDAGEAEAGLREAWPSPRPGARYGVADRLPPIGGIPQHQRPAALRGAVRPVSRSVYPQAVQNTRPPGQSVAPSGSRARPVPTSLRTIGKRWHGALKSVRIRPHLNFSSSSRSVIPDDTACASFTRCRSE